MDGLRRAGEIGGGRGVGGMRDGDAGEIGGGAASARGRVVAGAVEG